MHNVTSQFIKASLGYTQTTVECLHSEGGHTYIWSRGEGGGFTREKLSLLLYD